MSRQDFRFAFTIRVRYPEIDSQAVVFNSRYLEYFDLGIVEYLRAVGEEIYVHVSGSRGRPMPWKPEVIAALQSYEGRPLIDA